MRQVDDEACRLLALNRCRLGPKKAPNCIEHAQAHGAFKKSSIDMVQMAFQHGTQSLHVA
jgi:hypothetical protein